MAAKWIAASRIVALSAAVSLLLVACDGNADPASSDQPMQGGVSRGTPEAQAPTDPNGLAETVAKATAAMLANGDQVTADQYANDVQEHTGCTVQTSRVAYADNRKNRSLERRMRNELIDQLLKRPTTTAVGHARKSVGAELPSTIGGGARADLVGVVVALSCV